MFSVCVDSCRVGITDVSQTTVVLFLNLAEVLQVKKTKRVLFPPQGNYGYGIYHCDIRIEKVILCLKDTSNYLNSLYGLLLILEFNSTAKQIFICALVSIVESMHVRILDRRK